MSNTYNIYKLKPNCIEPLKEKLKSVGLEEQKTLTSGTYSLTFYFSSKLIGNEIWWWETYKKFFKSETSQPKNKFYFAMLLCINNDHPELSYAVSLGKSHFYLSKFIKPAFGIELAVRMADESTVLLKKSRYFAGTKRQDVSSYEKFQINNYEPGESVEHLKLKASEQDIWGEKNIIFADSIQMSIDKNPLELYKIFDQINSDLKEDEIISLPKLEAASSEIVEILDKLLLKEIKGNTGKVIVEEFHTYGVAICFTFHDYSYRLSVRKKEKSTFMDIGNTLSIEHVREFLKKNDDIEDINLVKVQFKNEENGLFTKAIKEVIDSPVTYMGEQYFLRDGDWYKFNQTFMDYLKKSIESIDVEIKSDLIEADYIQWKKDKISADDSSDNKITYREYYFNKKICSDEGYELLDRQLQQIKSLERKRQDYRVETADLYKDGEIISVKISENNQDLIYNIEQSKDAIELIMRKAIEFSSELKIASLWFVFEKNQTKITHINSIQFLLAVESWRKLALNFGLKTKIYISKHKK